MTPCSTWILPLLASVPINAVALVGVSAGTALAEDSPEALPTSYDVAVGGLGSPLITEHKVGAGVLGDLELPQGDSLAPFLMTFYTGVKADGSKSTNYLEGQNLLTLQPGVRHYGNPRLSSWVVTGSVRSELEADTYLNAQKNKYSWRRARVDLCGMGGYRWIFRNRLFWSLSGGIGLPVYDYAGQPDGSRGRTHGLFGLPDTVGLAAFGRLF